MKNDTKHIAKSDIASKGDASVASDTSIFDKNVLTELAAEVGSSTLIFDLSEIFFKNLPATFTAIDVAWKANNNETLAQCFHSLKGSAATLGMADLKSVCTGLERTFRSSENPTFTQEDLDSLKAASQQASQALKNFLKTLENPI